MTPIGFAPPAGLAIVRTRALTVGVIGSVVAVAIGWSNPTQFFP